MLVAVGRSMSTLSFTVLGRAVGAGSKRGFAVRKAGVPTGRVVMSADNPDQYAWQDSVRSAARRAWDESGGGPMLDGPLLLRIAFYLRRPASHYGTGRNAGVVKDSAPLYPTVKPDLSKLVRALEDGLTGVVITDDARVVTLAAIKRFGELERADVSLFEIATDIAA
jgi:Holliday junction resolvase RusA-like endonuclease